MKKTTEAKISRYLQATIERLAVEQIAREEFRCPYPKPFPAWAEARFEVVMEIKRRAAELGIGVK